MNDELPRSSGGRKLTIFGMVVIFIAIISASVSLFIYSATGDIYLDRSRPGFISDGESIKDDENLKYDAAFPPDGPIDVKILNEYLNKFDAATTEATFDSDAFSADALSDENLNITGSAED